MYELITIVNFLISIILFIAILFIAYTIGRIRTLLEISLKYQVDGNKKDWENYRLKYLDDNIFE